MKKVVVLSGINMIDGGILSIYQDCLKSLVEFGYTDTHRVIALVGRKSLFKEFESKVELIEFPKSKKSWFLRIFYEYFYFNFLCGKLKPNIWISMHDTTPTLPDSCKQYVYCHNSSQFSNMKFSEIKYGVKYYLFSKFYKYLYAINIKKNEAVIVQQNWIRKEFKKIYDLKNVIVARPSIPNVDKIDNLENCNEAIFIYPSFPRYFKNFQVLCEAADLLLEQGIKNFKVYITVDGTENQYSKELVERFSKNGNIEFCGLLARKDLFKLYSKANCLVFMSKLETFGMPILEFKQTGKAMLLSDLPYSHETAGDYDNVDFVDSDDVIALADKMLKVIKNKKIKGVSKAEIVEQPYAENWNELFKLIL